MPTTAWILSYIRPYRGRLGVLAVLSLVEIGLAALTPWPMKMVVDNVLSGRPLPEWMDTATASIGGRTAAGLLAIVLVAGLVIQVLAEIVETIRVQLQVKAGEDITFDVRSRLFAHLQALSLRHHGSVSPGDAVYRISSDAGFAADVLFSAVFPLATALLTLAAMLVILWRLDPLLAVVALGVVPLLFWIARLYMKPLGDRAERLKTLDSSTAQRIFETFSGIRIVKSFGREPHEQAQFARTASAAIAERVALTWQESLFSAAITSVTIVGTMMVLWVGGLHVLRGQLTVGALLVVIFYVGAVYRPLSTIAHTSGTLQEALASARRVRAALAATPEFVDAVRPARVELRAGPRPGHVAFNGVSFSYDGQSRVLTDVSFHAAPGELVALVGLSGAGKSTAAGLIPRFYDADGGAVEVDGLDVRRQDLRTLRARMALVPQEPLLFKGSIADNIRYGRLDATDDQVRSAASAAGADGFVEALPAGYASDIGEAGSTLSGGQRQQLCLARALLKEAPVLILDEPTSSLDAISEERIFEALRRRRAAKTTIVVAHRLSTIRDADRIVVFERGRVAATGRHDEILLSSEVYRRMWDRLCAS